MALTDFVDRVVPSWAKGSSRQHWWGVFRTAAVLIDGLIEGVFQGRKAGMANAVDLPGVAAYGGFEDVKSLDYLGEDVGVLHGLTEAPPDYAYRIRHAMDATQGWGAAGLVQGLLEQLAGVLGPNPPVMRIFQLSGGDWWTRLQDGTYILQRADGTGRRYNTDGTTTPDATMAVVVDWDSASLPAPPDQGFAGRWGLILYAPIDTPYGTALDTPFTAPGLFGDAWNDPTQPPSPSPWQGCIGTNTPIVLVNLIKSVVAQRATAGLNCAWIVFATDGTSFNPDGSSTGTNAYPTNGLWAWHTYYDAGTNTQKPARLATAEYWKVN
jgi:hypothetical protein